MTMEKKINIMLAAVPSYIAEIEDYQDPWWLTISPSVNDSPSNGDLFIEQWMSIFIKWLKAIRNCTIVMEVANLRFHWHIMLDIKDRYTWGILYRGLLKYARCQIKIYKGFPSGGIKYLFKSLEETMDDLKCHLPIIHYDKLLQIKEDKIKKRRAEFIKFELDHMADLKERERLEILHSKAKVFMTEYDSDSSSGAPTPD